MTLTHKKISGRDRYDLSQEDLRQIKSVLSEDSGIQIADDHFAMVKCRLSHLLKEHELESFSRLVEEVTASRENVIREKMVNALTTNVTHFFREKHHFDFLSNNLLNKPVGSFGEAGLRVWSAGCSNGAEPYSVAIHLLENLDKTEIERARILATDIDPNMVAHGQSATYPKADLEVMGRQLMLKHTMPSSGDSDARTIGKVARKMVTFNRLNLHTPWPMKKPFDVIFCRNVAIYFEEHAREELWVRFAKMLKPGGYLCIGHSERVRGPAQKMFNNCASTTYQRLDTE